MSEFDVKQERILRLLTERKLEALLLQRVSSFAWATCGAASYVNTAATGGEASLLVTPSGRYLVTNNIEATRLQQEERLADQGWEFSVTAWQAGQTALSELAAGLRLGADGPHPGAIDLSVDIARMRALLTPEEGGRFRELGKVCAEAMDVAARSLFPGQTEYAIAGRLAQEAESRGVQAIVNLVATDRRVFAFRHPLPTDKALERYAMLVLCGRRKGLVCSITRLVHFGRLPDELRSKAETVARVDARLISATRPGRTLGEVFREGVAAYAEVGYPGEWPHHHQGGPAGYEPREFVANLESTEVVSAGQVFAWNPSIRGTKSEDSVLITEQGHQVLTAITGWPTVRVEVEGRPFERPAILEIE